MPRRGITAYDLLISCPGDVSEFIDVIKECIENFNRVLGSVNNVEIVAKHWSTDSYPQSGGKPQELLNQQFVRECDAAVALFWAKFGTPTDKYGSGTEEEIEEMLASDKQVFMYFFDKPINLSGVDTDQYKKVEEFKTKYKDKGIYFVVKDENELRQQFTNHLAMYFLPLVMKDKGEHMPFEKKAAPILKVRDKNSEDESVAVLQHTSFLQCKLVEDKVQNIIDKILSIQKDYLPEREKLNVEENEEISIISSQADFAPTLETKNYILGNLLDVDIPDTWKNEIAEFADKNGVALEEHFWNLGNLKRSEVVLASLFNDGLILEGSDKEKQRYKTMEKLYLDILEYNEYVTFFSSIDQNGYVELLVANIGSTFDEDVDVKISIKKGCTCKEEELAIPEINIIEEIMKMQFCDYAFHIECDDTIDEYSGYPVKDFNYMPIDIPKSFLGKSAQEEYNENKEEYVDELKDIFCYEYYEKEDMDILTFHIDYIKHNKAMAFPSILIFKDVPDAIKYEISSKHLPNIIKGTIKIEK